MKTKLVRHSLLREGQTTEEGIRTAARSWRKRYPRSSGHSVRVFRRKLTFAGHELGMVIVAVLKPVELDAAEVP